MAERSRKSRPTAGLCARQSGADELRRRLANAPPMNEGGNFPPRKALKTQKTRKESRRGGTAPLHSPLRSRACPEMAPQGLGKIESARGNGMVSEAANPQDVVHRRAAGSCPIGSLSPGARPAKQRRWRRFIAPTNEEENFPPRKALKSHKTRKSTREGSLPELAASSRAFLAPAAPSAATLGRPWRPSASGRYHWPKGGYRDEKIWKQLCWVCDPHNPLKFHKTAKLSLEILAQNRRRFGKAWRKGLEPAFIPPFPLLPESSRLRHRPARGRPPPEA